MKRDINLLFGVLAVEYQQILPTQFTHAAEKWAADDTKDVADYLVELGALGQEDRRFVDEMLAKALEDHGGDASAALASKGGAETVTNASCGAITLLGSRGLRISTPIEEWLPPLGGEPHEAQAAAPPAEVPRPVEAAQPRPAFPKAAVLSVIAATVLLVYAVFLHFRLGNAREEARAHYEAARVAESAALEQSLAAERQRDRARAERTEVEAARDEALRQRDLATTQLNAARKTIEKQTRDMARLVQVPQTHPVLREHLAENAAILSAVSGLEPDPATARLEIAANLALFGDLWRQIGDTTASLNAYKDAALTTNGLAELFPNDPRLPEMLAQRYGTLALAYGDAGMQAEAASAYEKCIAADKTKLETNPNDGALYHYLALAYGRLGNSRNLLGDQEAALAAYESSLDMNERLIEGNRRRAALERSAPFDDPLNTFEESIRIYESWLLEDPLDTSLDSGMATAYSNLGLAYGIRSRYEEARASIEKSLEICDATSPDGDYAASFDARRARLYNHLGLIDGLRGDFEAARANHSESILIIERMFAADPGNPALRRSLASYTCDLGLAQLRLGAFDEAEGTFKTMLDTCAQPTDDPDLGRTQMASVHAGYRQAIAQLGHAGKADQALALHQAFVDLRRYFADLSPENADALIALADEQVSLGVSSRRASHAEDARASFQSALDIVAELAAKHPDDADIRNRVATLERRIARIEADK